MTTNTSDVTSHGWAHSEGKQPSRARFGSRALIGAVSIGLVTTLVACGSASDAEVGVQTAPTTQQTVTSPSTAAPLNTTGVTQPPTSQQPPASQVAVDDPYQQFSVCMRDNGYPDFEDFTADAFIGATSAAEGAKIFNEEMLRRGVDLADPATGPAMEACQTFLDDAAASAPALPGADEQAEQELILAFAECMRTQGVQDWPDPDFAANPPTGYSLEEIQSFDYQDPKISSAGQYCDPRGEVLALFGR